MKNALALSRAKYLIVEPGLLDGVLPAASEQDIPLSKIFAFDMKPKQRRENDVVLPLAELLNFGEADWVQFDDEARSKETTAALLFTSGTTGLPKAAAMSHFALVSMNIALLDPVPKPYEVHRLLCLPQFHSFNASLTHVAPLRNGHPIHIMRRFELTSFLDYVKRHGITETTMVPPMVSQILNSHEELASRLSSLRLILCAGSPLDRLVHDRLVGVLSPEARVHQVYGMTETGWITTMFYSQNDDTGSVGRLLPNVECKLLASDGSEIAEERVAGEILVRGPASMTGYLGNNEATEQAFDRGWLRTGDVGHFEDGKCYIVDRVKDMIKVRGWQVAPSELEGCLITHPLIVDAAVIGVELAGHDGEVPSAYIVPKKDPEARALSEQDVKDYISERFSKVKELVGGVKFVDSIPRNVSGKILRKELRMLRRRDSGVS